MTIESSYFDANFRWISLSSSLRLCDDMDLHISVFKQLVSSMAATSNQSAKSFDRKSIPRNYAHAQPW